MGSSELIVDNRTIRLGARIGKGGEGEVYGLSDDARLAVKLYTARDALAREPKIVAMIRANLSRRAPLVAFPTAIARRRDGQFAGFVMHKVTGHRPLHDLYAPGSRKHKFPAADYRFLARAASNIARAVASVHSSGCVIGDINHSGILISEKAVAALIDADSFQMSEGAQRHLCVVGVPEYTPPELQGQSLANLVRTPNHDAFGLAVVIFQLLFMGRHPFVGSVRKGDVPPLHEAIRDYRFAYAEHRNVGMDQPPGTPAISDVSSALANAFERAFSREGRDSRPSAPEWVKIIEAFEQSLIPCKANPQHYLSRDTDECPWCEMEVKLGAVLFLPFVRGQGFTIHPFDPGANGFNLEELCRQIESVPRLDSAQLQPVLPPLPTETTSALVKSQRNDLVRNLVRGAGFIVGIVVLGWQPALWILWGPLLYYAIFAGGKRDDQPILSGAYLQRYIDAERQWMTALAEWQQRCGVDELEALRKSFQQAAQDYRSLAAEERTSIAKYHATRRERQLQMFLDDFEIRDAKIKGIGPAKEAALKSYSVETAADVTLQKLLGVPGLGRTNSQPLLAWRQKLEARFVYRAQPDESDQQEVARIRSAIHTKASSPRRTLIAGPSALKNLQDRVKKAAETVDQVLTRCHYERGRALADLKRFGIPVPVVTPQPAPTAPSRTIGGLMPGPASVHGNPQCPRCGSAMVSRTARRGRRRGSRFWGCSRYPRCKATKNP